MGSHRNEVVHETMALLHQLLPTKTAMENVFVFFHQHLGAAPIFKKSDIKKQ